LRQIKSFEQKQYDIYVNERLVNQTKPITDPIKRNNLPLFSRLPVREKTRAYIQLSSLNNDCSLLSRLYIASQIRRDDLDQFFQHENQAYPPAFTSQLQYVKRLDVVWDEYIADSLKAETRTGKGIRRRVEPSNAIPGNWQEFLRINDNKTELFSFLATIAATIATDKQVIGICHTGVLCTQSRDVSGVAPYTHEEADARILLHLEDALKHGYNKISI